MYNPSQPRVPAGDTSHHGGRWTDGGAQLASMAAPAIGMGAAARVFAPAFVPYLRALLSRLPFGIAAPIGFLGAILIPSNRSLVAEGQLPSHPDIIYRYDAGMGVLTLWRNVPGDRKPLLFHGHADNDELFRLPDGTIIGRDLENGILLSQSATAIKLEEYEDTEAANPAANDNVKLCPDAVPDWPNNDKEGWQDYQQQITGLPKGLAVQLNGVMFDGCRMTDGIMLEAKGAGFAWAIENGEFFKNYRGTKRAIEQMQRQSIAAAAANRTIEWHVAEKPFADYLAKVAASLPHKNITVINTLPISQQGTR